MCLAIPGRIESTDSDAASYARVGRVSFGGIVKEINLAFVPEAGAGDYVLVHVGVAIQKIDEAEARRVFAILDEMELAELESSEDPGDRR